MTTRTTRTLPSLDSDALSAFIIALETLWDVTLTPNDSVYNIQRDIQLTETVFAPIDGPSSSCGIRELLAYGLPFTSRGAAHAIEINYSISGRFLRGLEAGFESLPRVEYGDLRLMNDQPLHNLLVDTDGSGVSDYHRGYAYGERIRRVTLERIEQKIGGFHATW